MLIYCHLAAPRRRPPRWAAAASKEKEKQKGTHKVQDLWNTESKKTKSYCDHCSFHDEEGQKRSFNPSLNTIRVET